ncbi:MAG: hypothetical protein SHS37scaffold220_32 [Phage 67_12]|nr:MAG: hypothetical protein SHS37scaffold220_32 [Phage 67_12]
MRDYDSKAFFELLTDVWSLKGQALSGGAKAMWFRALAAYPLPVVQGALDAHLADPKRGQFLPMPADVIAQIDRAVADDGRLGPEEAWALCARAVDETQTVVWTEEISRAYGTALPILQAGDEVGARMAFKEAYARLVDAARAGRFPPNWSVSEGSDPELRAKAIAEGIALGRLAGADFPALPAPRSDVALLSAPTDGLDPPNRASALQGLLALRTWLTTPAMTESLDAQARADTDVRKAAAAAKVAAHRGELDA